MKIAGIEEVAQLFGRLSQFAVKARSIARANSSQLRIRHTKGISVKHKIGRHMVAVTLPARHRKGWISVLNPRPGTSLGGDRKRFRTKREALKRSRQYTSERGAVEADTQFDDAVERGLAEIDALFNSL